jgi:hypothetical protein
LYKVLVVDSAESELNSIAEVLEEYKSESGGDFQIIKATSRALALQEIGSDGIDLMFISTDIESFAIEMHKQYPTSLSVALSHSGVVLKEWFMDSIKKPISPETFRLKLQLYFSILSERKREDKEYSRRVRYKIDSLSNLYFFWKNHYTNRWNIHRVINSLYIIALNQFERGIKSDVEITDSSREFNLVYRTTIDRETRELLETLCKKVEFSVDEEKHTIEFHLHSSEFKDEDSVRDVEQLALKYLDRDSVDLLNDYLAQSNLAEREDTDRESNIQIFNFMKEEDLELFEEGTSKIEILSLDYNGDGFSSRELKAVITSLESIKVSLNSYKDTEELSKRVGNLNRAILKGISKFYSGADELIEQLITIVTMLGTWHNSVIYQGATSVDFMFKDIYDSIDELIEAIDKKELPQ